VTRRETPRTQQERRAETRELLLSAAVRLFAQHGVDAVSVDAVAAEASRTSGAVYAHFGSKAGLLRAVLDEGMAQTAVVVSAELETAETPEERMAALWRNIAHAPGDVGDWWIALEHELWARATRDSAVAEKVAERYALVRSQMSKTVNGIPTPPGDDPDDTATLVLAMLIGLEMQHRIDPSAVPDEVALDGLFRLLSGPLTDARDFVSRGAKSVPQRTE
jgi:TetR/AcrR family acrAB operon transcriptional repressor